MGKPTEIKMLMIVLEFTVEKIEDILGSSFKMKENILGFIWTSAIKWKYNSVIPRLNTD